MSVLCHFNIKYLRNRMSDWNDFFSSGIFSARARTYWIYKAIQAYDLANRATLKLWFTCTIKKMTQWHGSSPSRCTLTKTTDQHYEYARRCVACYLPLRSSFRAFGTQGEVLLDGLHGRKLQSLSFICPLFELNWTWILVSQSPVKVCRDFFFLKMKW